jgi:hypothetical protein
MLSFGLSKRLPDARRNTAWPAICARLRAAPSTNWNKKGTPAPAQLFQGRAVDQGRPARRVLFAGNSLDKARALFAAYG